MDVLIVGGDPAVQEGVLQSIRASGLSAEVCPDLPCARDAVEDATPVALVRHETLATAVSEIANWNFNPGGITRQLMEDYSAEVDPSRKAAAA